MLGSGGVFVEQSVLHFGEFSVDGVLNLDIWKEKGEFFQRCVPCSERVSQNTSDGT